MLKDDGRWGILYVQKLNLLCIEPNLDYDASKLGSVTSKLGTTHPTLDPLHPNLDPINPNLDPRIQTWIKSIRKIGKYSKQKIFVIPSPDFSGTGVGGVDSVGVSDNVGCCGGVRFVVDGGGDCV